MCSSDPMTGFFRSGKCETCEQDAGLHTVCAEVTEDFLAYSQRQGNDLSTPMPAYHFPGLKPGDRWCVCAGRWLEAAEAGCAPPVNLNATHIDTLKVVPLELLKKHATA